MTIKQRIVTAIVHVYPLAWLWGIVGGHFGQRLRNARGRQTVSS